MKITLFVLACYALIMWGSFAWRNRSRAMWMYAAPAMLYLAHAVIFYACAIWYHPTNEVALFTAWSGALRLQGILSVLGVGLMAEKINRGWHG
jgi:hypothetical protein